jgi:tetratricopeptide (TPR) repeat protein
MEVAMVLALSLALQAAAPPSVCEPTWPRPRIHWDSTGTRHAMIAQLREAAEAAPKDGEGWLAYGLFLTITTTEKTSDWRERVEAEKALERALRLLSDPRPIAAFAVLRRKQGARMDSRRLIRSALGRVARNDAALGTCFEAELYYQMALIYRTWWEDWEGMTFMGGSVASFKPCVSRAPRHEGEPEEVTCPEQFYDAMSHRADLTDMRHGDRDAMIENLQAAVRAHRGHRDAWQALLLAYYEMENAVTFRQTLLAGLAVDSLNPWFSLWGATEAFGRHDIGASERYFTRALELLSPAERAALLSPERILTPDMAERWQAEYDSLYWRAADPLYLTETNERLLAHAARLTYAAAKYDVPLTGVPGMDTDAGFLLVRYGRPWRTWMTGFGTGGRDLIWAPDSLSPPLHLERGLTMRRWRFPEESDIMRQSLAKRMPERWNPSEAFDRFDSLPVEVARFEEDGTQVLDVYALWRNPYPDIPADTIRMGFYLDDGMATSLLDRRRTVPARDERLRLKFRAPLRPARYWYRVETLTGPLRAAGRARGPVDVIAPSPDSLRASDLLLGRTAREAPATIPHRDSLGMDPLYDLELSPGDSLVVYWETYGLRPDSSGTVRYAVSVEVREADRGALAEVIGRLGVALGLGRQTGLTVRWDVDAAAPDGVRRDVLVVDPGAWRARAYRLRVRIEERGSGRAAITERGVTVVEERR